MLCILYVIAMGFGLGIVALIAERAMPASWPRRGLWLAVIPLSVAIPGYYRFHHNWSVTAALEHHGALRDQSGTMLLAPLDPAFWARTQLLDHAINRVWIILSALIVLWGLAGAWRVWRLVHLARRQQLASRAASVVDGVSVVVTDAMGPATVGLLRSRVLVPRWVMALPATQRNYILRHEEEHRRAHDAQLLFFASLPLILMPWNVALWWLLRRLCLAVEMDCDNRVVAALGDANAYGALLLKVAEAGNRGPQLQPAFLGVGTLERRLRALLAPAPLRLAQRVLLPLLALGALAVVLSMPHPVVGHGTHVHASASSASSTPNGR
jgi:beta-lactamase regulating signal transducer with metallopeptidase domain